MIDSDTTKRAWNRTDAKPGPGMLHTYRCDFCRLVRSVAQGRKRVHGALWRCGVCGAK